MVEPAVALAGSDERPEPACPEIVEVVGGQLDDGVGEGIVDTTARPKIAATMARLPSGACGSTQVRRGSVWAAAHRRSTFRARTRTLAVADQRAPVPVGLAGRACDQAEQRRCGPGCFSGARSRIASSRSISGSATPSPVAEALTEQAGVGACARVPAELLAFEPVPQVVVAGVAGGFVAGDVRRRPAAGAFGDVHDDVAV